MKRKNMVIKLCFKNYYMQNHMSNLKKFLNINFWKRDYPQILIILFFEYFYIPVYIV